MADEARYDALLEALAGLEKLLSRPV